MPTNGQAVKIAHYTRSKFNSLSTKDSATIYYVEETDGKIKQYIGNNHVVSDNTDVVKLTGNQTIGGTKTFSNPVVIGSSESNNPGIQVEGSRASARYTNTGATGGVAAAVLDGRIKNTSGNTSRVMNIGMYGSANVGGNPTSTYMYLDSMTDGAWNNTTLKVDSQNRIGIAIPSSGRPTQALDVDGKIRMRTATTSGDGDDIVATKGYVDTAVTNKTTSWAEVSDKPSFAPSNAQKNSDITQAEIEAKLTGVVTSHTHNIAQVTNLETELNGKASNSDLTEMYDLISVSLDNKVDKVSGKGLSTNDFTTTDKQRLDVLHSLLEEDTSNNVVDSINEVLAIFNNYPEGADLVSALAGKVDKVGSQTIKGTTTLEYPTAFASGEQPVLIAKVPTSATKSGAISIVKEGPNSGIGLKFEQVEGTPRLLFRASATPGAMVWAQPEEGSRLYLDVSAVDFRGSGFLLESNGFSPKTNNVKTLGTNARRFSEIHASTFYENGLSLASKYTTESWVTSNTRSSSWMPTAAQVGARSNTWVPGYAEVTGLTAQLNNKVDKVSGKGLSENDFTNTLRTKLVDIEEGAQVNPYSKSQLDSKFNAKANNNEVVKATTENKNILGTTEEVFNISEKKVWFNKGALFYGTAAAAGLVTRGISGVTTDGSAKEHLYINYDGNNNYSRKLILGAGNVGDSYGNGIHQHTAVRGDAFIAYLNNTLNKFLELAGGTMTGPIDMGGKGIYNSKELAFGEGISISKIGLNGGLRFNAGAGGKILLELKENNNIEFIADGITGVPEPIDGTSPVNKKYVDDNTMLYLTSGQNYTVPISSYNFNRALVIVDYNTGDLQTQSIFILRKGGGVKQNLVTVRTTDGQKHYVMVEPTISTFNFYILTVDDSNMVLDAMPTTMNYVIYKFD